jgi:hypothetical protein
VKLDVRTRVYLLKSINSAKKDDRKIYSVIGGEFFQIVVKLPADTVFINLDKSW